MKKMAIFLDRDGTINVEKNYLYKPKDFVFEDKALEGMKILKDLGYLLVIVTNQAGIAKGYYTEEDLDVLNKYIISETKANGCEIDRIYYCPHHPEGKGIYKKICNCRKPNNGMIEQAITDLDIDRDKSYMVGDKIIDIQAGSKSDIRSVLVRTGYGAESEKELSSVGKLLDISVFDSLYNFAIFLLSKKNQENQ